MISKPYLRTLLALVCVVFSVAISILICAPLLQFAAAGNFHHPPTAIGATVIATCAYGLVPGFLYLSISAIYRFDLLLLGTVLAMSLVPMMFFALPKYVGLPVAFALPAVFIPVYLLRRCKPAIVAIQEKYIPTP